MGIGIGLVWFWLYTLFFITPLGLLVSEQLHTIDAVVLDIESGYTDELRKGTLQVIAVDGEVCKHPFKTVSYNMEDAEIGDKIKMRVQFENLTQQEMKSYNYSQRVYITADACSTVEIMGHKDTLAVFGKKLQKQITVALSFYMPKAEAGVVAAILTGDRSNLSKATYENFQKAGIAHLLVVSGFHLSLIAATVYSAVKKLFSKFSIREYAAVSAALCAVVVYAAVVGFTASVIRAGIMVGVYFFAKLLGRHSDGVTALGLAAVVIAGYNPYIVNSAGFWLSFLSTLGVILFSKWHGAHKAQCQLKGKKYYFAYRAAERLGTPLSATLATLPVILAIGGGFSAFGVFANMLAAILVTYILNAGMLVIIIYFVFKIKVLTAAIAFIAVVFTKGLLEIAKGFAALPGYIYIGGTATFILCLGVYALLIMGIKYGAIKKYAAYAGILLALGCTLNAALVYNTVTVAMVGQTQNPAVVIIQNKQAAVLYRGADKNAAAVANYLLTHNISEVEWLADLRTEGTSADYEDFLQPKYKIEVEHEVVNAQTISLFHDIIITIQHQKQGNAACIDISGYKMVLTAGTTNLSASPPINLFFAGTGRADELQAEKIIARTKWKWLDEPQYAAVLFKSAGTPQIWVRGGKAIVMKEVEEWF
ncbi:MAG: ComEC/Rec2 family competence protein [Oscillospiraceae bacterium]|nr:ComEC/Rec2 family competence protein [Oscillospiraceae bacterium]